MYRASLGRPRTGRGVSGNAVSLVARGGTREREREMMEEREKKRRKGGNRVRRPCAHCHAGSTTEHGHHVLVQRSRESFDDPRNPDTRQVRPSFSFFFFFFSTDRAFFLSFFCSILRKKNLEEDALRFSLV